MAKTKKKHSGKPRGMNYADMLARKRMIREAVQEAADDATVQLRLKAERVTGMKIEYLYEHEAQEEQV